jgi:cytochrome o ubiquinol oxidase operon protein cyoD
MEPRKSLLQKNIVGYALSILLTLAIFGLVYLHVSNNHTTISHSVLRTVIVITALIQLGVQSFFFLHISSKKERRFDLMAFVFALYAVAFIAIGSLWVMQNLNQNMSPEQVAKYLHNEN